MKINFSKVKCEWCNEQLEIFLCGGCDRYTCRECVHYLEHKCLHESFIPIESTGWMPAGKSMTRNAALEYLFLEIKSWRDGSIYKIDDNFGGILFNGEYAIILPLEALSILWPDEEIKDYSII